MLRTDAPCTELYRRIPTTLKSRWSLSKCCRLGIQEMILCCDWNMNMNTLPIKYCIQLASGLSTESPLYPGLKPALMVKSGRLSLWISMAAYMHHHFTWVSCIPGCLWHPCCESICWYHEYFPGNYYKSTLVQVMAWCRQATSHYLGQCFSKHIVVLCV